MAVIKKTSPMPSQKATPPPEEKYERAAKSSDDLIDGVISESKEFNNPDPGRYEAVVHGVKSIKIEGKGLYVIANIVMYNPDNEDCRKDALFFKMMDVDGNPDEWGPYFYNRFMGKLGYEAGNRGAESRKEVSEEQPAIMLKVSASKTNASFVNREIESALDDDEGEDVGTIRQWIENNPF